MECPVCGGKVSLSDEDINAPEAYYDCMACHSSLLFQKGKCQVLAEGAAHKEPPAEEKQPLEQEPQQTPESQSEELAAGPEPAEPANGASAVPEQEGGAELEAAFDGGAGLQNADEPAALESPLPDQREAGGDGPPADGGQPEGELDQGAPAEGGAELAEGFSDSSENNFSEDPPEGSPLEKEPLEAEGPEGQPGPPAAPGEEPPSAAEQPPEESAGGQAEGQTEDQPAGLENQEENQEEDFGFSGDEPAEPQSPAPEAGEKEDFSEVSKYGNTPAEGEDGIFCYDLFLSGINSNELKEAVRMVLDDEYLKISPEEKEISIKDGALRVSKISPVKAHVIVKSLIGLPMGISWKQHLAVDQKAGEEAPAAESKENG